MSYHCWTEEEIGSATANDPKSSREKTEARLLRDEESKADGVA